MRDIADLLDEGRVLAIHGKGGRTRHIALLAGPARRLWALVARPRQSGRTASGRAMTPHWLRHACASHSLDRGAPVHVVQQTLGHASLVTTSRYMHARPG